MKDVSVSSSKRARNSSQHLPKRPTVRAGGISKSRTPFSPVPPHARRPPRSAKSELLEQYNQRQRAVAALALKQEGILIEEEYRDEIRLYMHEQERGTIASTQSMDQQPEIQWHMRPDLVDFLVEIHFYFRLRPETLYLTLNTIDRYVSRRVVHLKHYQLVGTTALWLAAKFEEGKEKVPTLEALVDVCQGTFETTAFLQMECHILSTLQWSLGHPTAEAWLRILCCENYLEEPKVQHVARFLMELTLFYREYVKYTSSSIALASLILARFLCGKPRRVWEETEDALDIVVQLDDRLATKANKLSETVIRKYSYAFYSKAATSTLEFYLRGGRFVRETPSLVSAPVTPARSTVSSAVSTPLGSTTSDSDLSDDFPLTPSTPVFPSEDGSFDAGQGVVEKENIPFMLYHKEFEKPPAEFLPHDYVTLVARPSLYNLHVSPGS